MRSELQRLLTRSTAFDLCELGESMRRAQLRREHPNATDEVIEALLVTWLERAPVPSTVTAGAGHLLAAVAFLSRAEAALRRITTDLRDLGRRFALVGGLAVSARTEPRLTRDADLAVLVADDRDAEALVRDLQACGWRVVAAIEQNAAGRLATVRLALAGETSAGRS